jgi:hypothetical protein
MHDPSKIEHFLQSIMAIDPRHNQANSGMFSPMGSSTDVLMHLKESTSALVSALTEPNRDRETVLQQAETVEGNLRTLQVLGSLTAKELNALLHELHSLE